MSNNLAENFSERQLWFHNRANAVFMCYVNSANDNILVFQNYWRWKNNNNEVSCVIRIRYEDGKLLDTKKITIDEHNEISIKQLFNLENFIGSIDVEILSTNNLGFPFPAVLCFYKNINAISVVHSAGRILNSHEENTCTEFEESNFLSRYDENFEPFIHLFCGAYPKNRKITISFFDYDNKLILSKSLSGFLEKSFSSKILRISEICSNEEIELLYSKEFFIVLKTDITGIFGRYLVGVYNNKIDAYFVTHSFRKINEDNTDFTIASKDYDATTFLPIVCDNPLQVEAISYPTNAYSEIDLNSKSSGLGENLIDKEEISKLISGGSKGRVFRKNIKGDGFLFLYSKLDAPSRINVNYNYSLPNSIFPTDIATGFKSYVYPPKVNHWGSGYSPKHFETFIFVRNCLHNFKESKASDIILEIFTNSVKFKKKYVVGANSAINIKLSDLKIDFGSESFFSWRIKFSQISVETFWISFSTNSGQLCGEHGF